MTPEEFDVETPVAEILQAEWAKDQVLQLFADLAAGADVHHVQLKTLQMNGTVSLATAERAFANNEAHAIQVRYLYENELWCDTIMPGNPTTKIIRNRVPTTHPS